jgi:hypothetical protein
MLYLSFRFETDVIHELEDFFQLNPTATRSEAVVHSLNKKINFEEGPQVLSSFLPYLTKPF